MWDIIIQPMVNGLLLVYWLLFSNFTLTIVVFTILSRLVVWPLTQQQQKSSKKLAELQQSEAFKKMQEKYAKDKEKLAQEQMKLYKEAGVNPLGGCLPLFVQIPIMGGLYAALTLTMAASPMQLFYLSQIHYSFLPSLASLIPIDNRFLWLNLGLRDPYYILPILVVVTTWIQSKVMTPPSADPQAAQMSQSMAVTMPLMIGWFSLQVASGLSIYWIVGNILSVVQYALMPGMKINWKNVLSFRGPATPAPTRAQKKKSTRA